jgi:hypothetical protein
MRRLRPSPAPIESPLLTIEALSLAGFTLSLAGFTAAFEEQSPRLDKTRWCCLGLTTSVLWICLIGHVPTWTMLLSCFGFLISLVSVALASFAERETAERKEDEEEPAWWPEFEQDFRSYARQASEQRRTG